MLSDYVYCCFIFISSPTSDIVMFLKHVKDTYNNPEIYVTDTGKSDCGTLYDEDRIQYMRAYIDSLLKCECWLIFFYTLVFFSISPAMCQNGKWCSPWWDCYKTVWPGLFCLISRICLTRFDLVASCHMDITRPILHAWSCCAGKR